MEPTYELCEIRECIKQGKSYILETASKTAALLGYLQDEIMECVLDHLSETHFYKTMPSDKVPGVMQDVYKMTHQGNRLYIKLQINKGGNAVVVSFKADDSP